MTIELSIIVAAVGCLVGVAGWLAGRDKRVAQDAEWRGQVNAKLDVIVGINSKVAELDREVNKHGERIKAAEASAAQAHHRIDEIREDIGKK
jgi:outer membrane murein-binding lipoprotein Lpp